MPQVEEQRNSVQSSNDRWERSKFNFLPCLFLTKLWIKHAECTACGRSGKEVGFPFPESPCCPRNLRLLCKLPWDCFSADEGFFHLPSDDLRKSRISYLFMQPVCGFCLLLAKLWTINLAKRQRQTKETNCNLIMYRNCLKIIFPMALKGMLAKSVNNWVTY